MFSNRFSSEMSIPPSCLPNDLLERLKQYDVTIVPSQPQEHELRCRCLPEVKSSTKMSSPRQRPLIDQTHFQKFESSGDPFGYVTESRTWHQSKDEDGSIASYFDRPVVNKICSPKRGNESMTFDDYRPLSQQKLQEFTPKRKVQTEETVSSPFQHGVRFKKVIYSKLTGQHLNIEPKPRKRLRFDEDISTNLLDDGQSEFDTKSSHPYPSCDYNSRIIPDDVIKEKLCHRVQTSAVRKAVSERVCCGFVQYANEDSNNCLHCERNESQNANNSFNENNRKFRLSKTRCCFSRIPSNAKCRKHGNAVSDVLQKGSDICACAAMKQYFVKMAEHAFKNIRRRNATPGGFDQFLVEINTTNELLRQTLKVLQSVRGMCDHVVRK